MCTSFVGGGTSVYNPYSILQFFRRKRFSNYCFESGTPSFLLKLIKKREYDLEPLNSMDVPEMSFSSYEIELKKHIFIFEFKLNGTAVSALQQIRTHEYS